MTRASSARGFTLLEVLITMLILVFGLLGLANLQAKMNLTQMESYQRAQAVVLLQDMVDRIANNRTAAKSAAPGTPASYVTGSTGLDAPLGTGYTPPNNWPTDPYNPDATLPKCSSLPTMTERDKCDWHWALIGAQERRPMAPPSGGGPQPPPNNIGGMVGARGCIVQVQAANPAPGVCAPAIYRVTVAWQGINGTQAPTLACGQGQYGNGGAVNDTWRRAISQQVVVSLPGCG